jgi:hypothetical protein
VRGDSPEQHSPCPWTAAAASTAEAGSVAESPCCPITHALSCSYLS